MGMALLLLSMAFLGFTVGVLAGNSRTAATDSLISLFVAVFGGILVYLQAKGGDIKDASTALSLIILCVLTSYGVHVGANFRAFNQLEERSYQEQLLEYKMKLSLEEYRQRKLIDLKTILEEKGDGY